LARGAWPALLAIALAATGCGEGGASSGATVSIYVAAPLCQGAQRELRREAHTVEDLDVRILCLRPGNSDGRPNLAQSGANARRATEDSTAVAFLEAAGPAARFSRPIVEAADIGWTTATSGAAMMRVVLRALAEGDSSSPRADVREVLNEVS
jgi:hypothetical protein